MNKVLVVYSGGLDSTSLLYRCLSEFDEVEAINFNYGSKHNDKEREAAEKICKLAGIKLTKVELTADVMNLHVKLTSIAGESATYIIPISFLPS